MQKAIPSQSEVDAIRQSRQEYKTVIALVADEIWLRNNGDQKYCSVLTKDRLKIKP